MIRMDGECDHGEGFTAHEGTVVGLQYSDDAGRAVIGDDAVIRHGTIIYGDVEIGDGFRTGHNALVRERTTIGNDVVVGTATVIDGTTRIGSHVSLQTGVYVPTNTEIGSEVFVGPRAVLTNDPYPVRTDVDLSGPTLEDHVSVGANATLLPDVTVGTGSFVAAGAVVTEDVPPDTLAMGTPAEHFSIPEQIPKRNSIA